jgi:hypothetical protein
VKRRKSTASKHKMVGWTRFSAEMPNSPPLPQPGKRARIGGRE